MNGLAEARVALTYVWRHRRLPSLATPRRFTDWVQWRKLHDRDPELARLTDKAHSKRFAAAALGEAMVIPTLWDGIELPREPAWPMPFIVKANHGCEQYIVVRDMADYRRALRRAPGWLRHAYGGWLDEWHYRSARRSLLVEPYLGPARGLPLDYKFYVFGGQAVMIQLHEGRGGVHRWSRYDLGWRPLSTGASPAPPPASLAEMIAAAEFLAHGRDFVRVDFYEVAGRPLFGEFCLFPGSGLDPFDPVELDDWLGDQWSAQWRATDPARITSVEAAPA